MATEERPAQGAQSAQPGRPPTQPKRPPAETARLIGLGLIAAYLIAFVVENSKSIDVHFVFFTRRPPLIWVMFACAVLGGALGYLIGKPGQQLMLRRRPNFSGDESTSGSNPVSTSIFW